MEHDGGTVADLLFLDQAAALAFFDDTTLELEDVLGPERKDSISPSATASPRRNSSR